MYQEADLASDRKQSDDKKVKKQQKLFQWCHQCKQKHDHVLHCSRDCNKKYCAKCLHRHYDEKEADIDPDNWVCVYCRQICCCAFCRKKKAKATNTKFESRRGKKRSLSSSWRSSLKKRKTLENSLKDFTDSDSESSDQSTPNDDFADDDFDDDDSSDMKLEVRDSPPDSFDALSRFPPKNIQVADLYFFLKNDLLNSHHLIHGPFEEVESFSRQNSETISLQEFYTDVAGSAFDPFDNPLLLLSEEPELRREDSSSSCMWADAILR